MSWKMSSAPPLGTALVLGALLLSACGDELGEGSEGDENVEPSSGEGGSTDSDGHAGAASTGDASAGGENGTTDDQAPPAPEPVPAFSWATIPRWLIVRSHQRISDEAITRIANHYQLTILEKSNTQGFETTEEGLADLAPRLKAVNPKLVNLAYWNSHYYWPSYGNGEEFLANPDWSTDPVGTTGRMSLDHSNEDMQEWWVRSALGLFAIEGIDGLDIDTLRPGSQPMVAEMHAELPDEAITIGNGTWREDYWLDYFDGSYTEGWGSTTEDVIFTIEDLQAHAARGKIRVFRGSPNYNTRFTGEEAPSDLNEQLDFVERNVDFSLAVYLVGAGEQAYFQYGYGPPYAAKGENITNYIWDTSYMEVFSRPLGEPLGPARVDGYVYSRSFEHLDVLVNVDTGETSFDWDEN